MTTVDKLVYLLRREKITVDQVAPQYREQAAKALGIEAETGGNENGAGEIVQIETERTI